MKLEGVAMPRDAASSTTPEPIMRVENLSVHFPVTSGGLLRRRTGSIRAVDGVSFDLAPGETLGIVGESGCGKSTLGRALLRLYEPTAGRIVLEGEDMAAFSPADLKKARRKIQMIFQDPYSSLDPRMTVGRIIAEPLAIHGGMSSADRQSRVSELLRLVELNEAHSERYPHEFSGGQRQRIGIARALALEPDIVVCDEPISALDVSIQAQIINLLAGLQKRLGLSLVFISHDLGMVRHISDRIAVMYLGQIVELADCDSLFENPMHPYTRALLSAICVPDPSAPDNEVVLEGDPPSPAQPPEGCRFCSRCPMVADVCRTTSPSLVLRDRSFVACHMVD
jgi:oligopeptide transport system ATP-binding protein